MTEKDLKVVTIENDDGVFVNHENTYILLKNFINRFEGARFLYKDLINHRKTTPAWRKIFDDWEKKGILN